MIFNKIIAINSLIFFTMELDNFFRNKQQNRGFDYDQSYQNNPFQNQNFRNPNHRHNSRNKLAYFLQTLNISRKLKGLIIVVLVVILIIIIALAAVLIPLIVDLLNYVSQNGIQGIVEYIIAFLEKLWEGSNK